MGQLQDMMMRTQGQPTGRQLTQGMVANPPNQQEDPRRLEEHMMRTQGVQGRASGANTPYGPTQSPPPMQPPPNQMASYGGTSGQNYASPGGQFAGQMDPEMLAMIVQMMQATMGQAPMGSPQQGWMNPQQGWMNPQQGPMQPSTPYGNPNQSPPMQQEATGRTRR